MKTKIPQPEKLEEKSPASDLIEPELDPYGENYRVCTYCGDPFITHHKLQQYCPYKYGRANYCKHQQRALINEKRLSDRAIELAKVWIPVEEETPLDKNIKVLQDIMGSDTKKTVTSTILDSMGYNVQYFTSRSPVTNSEAFRVHVGDFSLEWVGKAGIVLTFNISKL